MTTDSKKSLDCYRSRRGEFGVLELPPLQVPDGGYGCGDPNTVPAYAEAVGALFPVA